MSNTRDATTTDIDAARYGDAKWARFRNGITDAWRDGYLVGWIQSDQPWVCGRFQDTDHLIEECDFY